MFAAYFSLPFSFSSMCLIYIILLWIIWKKGTANHDLNKPSVKLTLHVSLMMVDVRGMKLMFVGAVNPRAGNKATDLVG